MSEDQQGYPMSGYPHPIAAALGALGLLISGHEVRWS